MIIRPPTLPLAGQRIGLFGGSFNPAHQGHLEISVTALRRLELDRIWWLVSPQNPLKSTEDMAPLADRMASAKAMAQHPRISVTDLEVGLGTRYTDATLRKIRFCFPRPHFVWIMGADNLLQLPDWQNWTRIMETMPVAVFARPPVHLKAPRSKAAQRYAQARLEMSDGPLLAHRAPPAWIYLADRLIPLSSTRLRCEREHRASR